MDQKNLDETLAVIMSLADRHPIELMPARLEMLFERLAEPDLGASAGLIEDEIWEIWTNHDDPAASKRMDDVISAIAARDLLRARVLVDALVKDHPLWPEAWNKRATLLFLRNEDDASVRDIGRTLLLEPRHFGAISGFGQICLRHGDLTSACLSFQAALRIHPHLTAVRIAVDELKRAQPYGIH